MALTQKAAIVFEATKGEKSERTYQLIVPVGAPFGEVFDVVFEMLNASEQLSKQAVENAKKSIDEAKEKEVASGENAQEVTAEVVQ